MLNLPVQRVAGSPGRVRAGGYGVVAAVDLRRPAKPRKLIGHPPASFGVGLVVGRVVANPNNAARSYLMAVVSDRFPL